MQVESSDQSSVTFSLITQNAFGLPFFLGWPLVLRLIEALRTQLPTVICLQEIQQNFYLPIFKRRLAETHPYQTYEPFLYAPKGGLLTLSQKAVEGQRFTLYRQRGNWFTLSIGDWALHKGVLETHLTIKGRRIVVLNTHLNANYRGDWSRDNPYAQIEGQQVEQLSQVVRAQPENALVLLAGDFNFPRGSWLYDKLLAEGTLIDPLAGDRRPTYRPFAMLSKRYAMPLDMVLVRKPPWPGLQIRADVLWLDQLPDRGGFVSDHSAVTLQATWPKPATAIELT